MFTLVIGMATAVNVIWTTWVNNLDWRDLWSLIPIFLFTGTLGGLSIGIGFSLTWSMWISYKRSREKKLSKALALSESDQRIASATSVLRVVKNLKRSSPSWEEVKIAWQRA